METGYPPASEVPTPEDFYSDALIDYSYKKYVDMYPIQHWLYEMTLGL